jgi:thiol-disulfide isomerase/thioredoxin
MRIEGIVLLLVLLSGCGQSTGSLPLTIEGAIEHPEIGSITLSGDEILQKAPLENGRFTLSASISRPGYYTLWHDRHRASLFLRPGMHFTIRADASRWEETLTFEGEGAAPNNFLQEQRWRRAELFKAQGSFQDMTKLDETAFLHALENIYQSLHSALREWPHSPTEEDFVGLEHLQLDLEEATRKLKYPEAHSYFTRNPDYRPGPSYYGFLEKLNWNDPAVLKLDIFDDFTAALLDYRAAAHHPDNPSIDDWLQTRLDLIDELFTEVAIRDHAVLMITDEALGRDGIHLAPRLVEQARKSMRDGELRRELERRHAKWAPLAGGQPAPEFTYPDIKDEPVSLADLRGRFLYVDVWATWCGPCLRELPYLEGLQEAFAGEARVAFVSVSIDENPEAWRRFITQKELKGLQLLADKGWSSQICLDYQISALPRFLLIDPEGRLIDADAPLPSSGKVQGLLAELL